MLYWEHIGNRAIRQENWKMVYDCRDEKWKLYNLEADPTELNDLADRYPERVEKLDSLWQAWADSVGVFPRPS